MRNVELIRQAKPSKDAEKITYPELVDVARVTSLRMWDAYDKVYRRKRKGGRPLTNAT